MENVYVNCSAELTLTGTVQGSLARPVSSNPEGVRAVLVDTLNMVWNANTFRCSAAISDWMFASGTIALRSTLPKANVVWGTSPARTWTAASSNTLAQALVRALPYLSTGSGGMSRNLFADNQSRMEEIL